MEAVLARMRALDERLPPQDGVAVFNRVYLTVTETLHRRIEHGGSPRRAGRRPSACGSRSGT